MVQIRQFWIELRHLGMPLVYEVIVQFTGGHFEVRPKIIYRIHYINCRGSSKCRSRLVDAVIYYYLQISDALIQLPHLK